MTSALTICTSGPDASAMRSGKSQKKTITETIKKLAELLLNETNQPNLYDPNTHINNFFYWTTRIEVFLNALKEKINPTDVRKFALILSENENFLQVFKGSNGLTQEVPKKALHYTKLFLIRHIIFSKVQLQELNLSKESELYKILNQKWEVKNYWELAFNELQQISAIDHIRNQDAPSSPPYIANRLPQLMPFNDGIYLKSWEDLKTRMNKINGNLYGRAISTVHPQKDLLYQLGDNVEGMIYEDNHEAPNLTTDLGVINELIQLYLDLEKSPQNSKHNWGSILAAFALGLSPDSIPKQSPAQEMNCIL